MRLLSRHGKTPCYNLDTFLQKTTSSSHFPDRPGQFSQKHYVFCHLSFLPVFLCTTFEFLGAPNRTGNLCCMMQRAKNRWKGAWSCHLTVAWLERMYNHKLQSWFYFCSCYVLGSYGALSPTPQINLTELQDQLMPLYQTCPCFPWPLVQCVDELRWSLDRQGAWSVMKFLIQNKNQKAVKTMVPMQPSLLHCFLESFSTSLFLTWAFPLSWPFPCSLLPLEDAQWSLLALLQLQLSPCSSFFPSKELRQVPAKEARHISANSCSLKICKIRKYWEDCSSRGYSFREHSGPSPFLSDGFLNSSGAVEQSFTTFFSMPDTSSQMQITYAPMHCFTFRNTTALIYCRFYLCTACIHVAKSFNTSPNVTGIS